MIEKSVIIKSKAGLHARPAAIFVQVANKFDSEITITKGHQKVNGKSIMGVLMLAAGQGQEVIIIAEGPDAEMAIRELEKILLNDEDRKTTT
ncbi:MAG: HPr family phosphocarrier protein [Candidatus Omnitrophota bacterium]